MKKLFSLVMCVMLVLAMAVPVFAEGSGDYGFDVTEEESAAKQARDAAYEEFKVAKENQESLEAQVPGKQEAADKAAADLAAVEKPMEEAKAAKESADSALATAEEEKAASDKVVTDAEKALTDAEKAQSDAEKAKTDAAANKEAADKANTEAAAAKKDADDKLAAAKKELSDYQAAMEKLKNSRDFFAWLSENGDTDDIKSDAAIAVRVLDNKMTEADKTKVFNDGSISASGATPQSFDTIYTATKLGDAKDATHLENMKKAVKWFNTGNTDYRQKGGLNALTVSPTLMAMGQIDANYITNVAFEHTLTFSALENIARRSSTAGEDTTYNPYKGWHDDEKLVYDYKKEHPEATAAEIKEATGVSSLATGHYQTLMEVEYPHFVTGGYGYAIGSSGSFTTTNHAHQFGMNTALGSGVSVTDFNNYITKYENSISEKETALKAAADEAQKKADDAAAKAEAAEDKLDEAETALSNAETALTNAKNDAATKKSELDAAKDEQTTKGTALTEAQGKAADAKDKYDAAKKEYDDKEPGLREKINKANDDLTAAKNAAAEAKEKREAAGDKLIETQAAYDALIVKDMSVQFGEEACFVGDTLDPANTAVTITHEDGSTEELGEDDFEFDSSAIPETLSPEEILAAKEEPIEAKVGVTYNGKLVEGTVKVSPRDYEIIENADGIWTKGSSESHGITSDAPFDKHNAVYVDGKEVSASNYTASEGSTRIDFELSYMESLSLGEHSIQVFAKDGVAETTVEVGEKGKSEYEEPVTPGGKEEQPATPDNKPSGSEEKTDPANGSDSKSDTSKGSENKPAAPDNKSDNADEKSETPDKKSETPDKKSDSADKKSDSSDSKSTTPEKKSASPNTGDESNAMLWVGLILLALVVGIAFSHMLQLERR